MGNKMNRKRLRYLRWIVAGMVMMFMIISIGLIPTEAAENTASQTVKVEQTVTGSPTKTSFVYAIVQTKGTAAMPASNEEQFTLSGNSSNTIHLTFHEAGLYEYTVGRLKDESKKSGITIDDLDKGDAVLPPYHPIGFKVTENEDGSLSVIPYTCYDSNVVFLKDGSGMTLTNEIKGPVVTPTPTPTPTPSTTPKGSTDNNNGKGQYTPKTGDDFQLILSISIAGISGILFILFLLMGRKERKKDIDSE